MTDTPLTRAAKIIGSFTLCLYVLWLLMNAAQSIGWLLEPTR